KAGEARSIGYTALLALRERGDGSEKREMALPPAERRRWLRFLVDYAEYVFEKRLKGKNLVFQLLGRRGNAADRLHPPPPMSCSSTSAKNSSSPASAR
ncbi:MAG: hypothetical protein LBU23_13590, partial [Planctomycetota bacterium]|nr:hypothetical protein [Planctomycetota bacterium]